MNINDAKQLQQHPELLQALIDGQLEVSYKGSYSWEKVINPEFDFDDFNYRVRREPFKIIFASRHGRTTSIDENDVKVYQEGGYTIFDAVQRL